MQKNKKRKVGDSGGLIDTMIYGDSLEKLKNIPDNSIDTMVTDPPYALTSNKRFGKNTSTEKENYVRDNQQQGLARFAKSQGGFMGLSWDSSVPPVELWRECLRVLKPGGFSFIMSSPRQDCLSRMIVNLEDAGFDINFTSLYWCYASGFPKALNISKTIDRQECKKELIKKLGRKPTSKEFDEEWKEYQNVIGENKYANRNPNGKWGIGLSGNDNTQLRQVKYDTIPKSDKARELEGSYAGFQPKPAIEIIIVAMKPLKENNYVEQAKKNHGGITFLDKGRIPYKKNDNAFQKEMNRAKSPRVDIRKGNFHSGVDTKNSKTISTNMSGDGRFPANLLVSDEILNDGIIRKSIGGNPNIEKSESGNIYNFGAKKGLYKSGKHYEDEGDFSRYFDLDLWAEERLNDLPEFVRKTFPFFIIPKPSTSEKDMGLGNIEEKQWRGTYKDSSEMEILDLGNSPKINAKNFHPTVKPILLMMFLIMIGSKEGDIILDPFAGSATTCIAAKVLQRKFIGIELIKEHYEIGLKRLKEAQKIRHEYIKDGIIKIKSNWW